MAKKQAVRKPDDDKFAGIKEAFGIPLSRRLDLLDMDVDVGRIGYDDEGLRLTLSLGSPYQFNAEVKLSRGDAQWLIDRLQAELAHPKNANLPTGTVASTGAGSRT
jgi:hypothetical protein